MIINTEWGGFKAASLPRLPADEAVDVQSVNPGWQTFEKLISGLYLGRVAAQLLLRADAELGSPLFDADTRARLEQPGAFSTPLVAAVVRRVCCLLAGPLVNADAVAPQLRRPGGSLGSAARRAGLDAEPSCRVGGQGGVPPGDTPRRAPVGGRHRGRADSRGPPGRQRAHGCRRRRCVRAETG